MHYPESTYMDEILYGDFSAAAFKIKKKASYIHSLNYAHTLSKGLCTLAFKIEERALDPSHPDFSDYERMDSLFENLRGAKNAFTSRCRAIDITSPTIKSRLKKN